MLKYGYFVLLLATEMTKLNLFPILVLPLLHLFAANIQRVQNVHEMLIK